LRHYHVVATFLVKSGAVTEAIPPSLGSQEKELDDLQCRAALAVWKRPTGWAGVYDDMGGRI
jgi:hypothetical protein